MTAANVTSPRAGWLAKLSSSMPFGRSRWQRRYLVLLSTELRIYKDEHQDIPSHCIDLHTVSDIIVLPQHRIRLEPAANGKPWTFACACRVELDAWVEALRVRLPYHAITTAPTPRKLSGPPPSLSRRRGILLAPIIVDSLLSDNAACSSSSSSSLIQTPSTSNISSDSKADGNSDNSQISPTFLMYKERFHLN